VLAIDRVEAEPDRHQRNEKRQKGHERRERLARRREQPQEQKWILRRDVFDLLDSSVDGSDGNQHDQPFEHPHAHTGEMIGEFFQEDDAETLPG
jgi:hypothetical protein